MKSIEQEKNVQKLNNLMSQVEQIKDLLPKELEAHNASSYRDLHFIAAKVKVLSASNQKSTLYKICAQLEDQLFALSNYKGSVPENELRLLRELIDVTQEQLGLIYKNYIFENRVKSVFSSIDFKECENKVEENNGYLKINLGQYHEPLFSKREEEFYQECYRKITPKRYVHKKITKKDAFLASLGSLIDIKNTKCLQDYEVFSSIEELCYRFDQLQTMPLVPVVTDICEKMQAYAADIEKPLEITSTIDDINVSEEVMLYLGNFLNYVFELIILYSLESNEYRVSIGKSLPYKIAIDADYNEFSLKIRIKDDGRGKELLSRLDKIDNQKATLLKELLKVHEISYSEQHFLNRETIFEFEIPLERWYFKAYLINSNKKDYLIPLIQVKSFIKLTDDQVINNNYYLGDGKVRYYQAGGQVPSSVENRIGILHQNESGESQILVVDEVSDPTFVRLEGRYKKGTSYIGTCLWKDNKEVSVFDVKKLCYEQKEGLLGIA